MMMSKDRTGCDIHICICPGLSEEFRRQCSIALRVRYQHVRLGDLGKDFELYNSGVATNDKSMV